MNSAVPTPAARRIERFAPGLAPFLDCRRTDLRYDIVAGVLSVAGRFLRPGGLADFLSKPILVGFLNGVSLSILLGQAEGQPGFHAVERHPEATTIPGLRLVVLDMVPIPLVDSTELYVLRAVIAVLGARGVRLSSAGRMKEWAERAKRWGFDVSTWGSSPSPPWSPPWSR